MTRRIAVLTSGGDAPGMNAAIRAVVRSALARGWQPYGVERGFAGLIAGAFLEMGARDVGGVIQRGGTILGSARCPEFHAEASRAEALKALEAQGIDGLVVIGGGGSQTGSHALAQTGFPVVGVASTIDNDLVGSEITIGVDTALNVAIEAIDRLKITASSHHRGFLVEVMGRDCGYLALMAAIAGGAEAVILPEAPADPEAVAREISRAYERRKAHAIVVVAEGAAYDAERLSGWFAERHARLGFELRVTKIGHVQRGGAPGAFDRILATRLGAEAVAALARGEHGVLVGQVAGHVRTTPLGEIVGRRKPLDPELLQLAKVLTL